MSTPLEVRSRLIDALRFDLIGPTGALGTPDETLFHCDRICGVRRSPRPPQHPGMS